MNRIWRNLRACALALVGAAWLAPSALAATEPFELRDGDRVALVGSTVIEREQRHGYWEAALTARWPDRDIVFRNLGWSGDTVWGDARAAFDTAKEGYQRLLDMVNFVKPSVIVVCYGQNEAFAGEAGLDKFVEGYGKLLDDLAKTGARITLMTPPPLEACGPPLPDPAEANRKLDLYVGAIRKLAEARGVGFADLHGAISAGGGSPRRGAERRTENGIDFTEAGYRATIRDFERALGLKPTGVETGAEAFARLRGEIVEKNRLFFHRWRPQNETYLFGFRKHEQGRNAKEVPQFDPLVEEAERTIAGMRGLKVGGAKIKGAAEGKK